MLLRQGRGDSRTSGALGGVVPSGRGAPGAFGSALGSNASDRLGLGATPGWSGASGASATSESGGGRRRSVAEPELDVLAELLQQRLEPVLRVLQFLDPAVGLTKLFLEPIDAHNKRGRLVGIARPRPGISAGGGAWRWKISN